MERRPESLNSRVRIEVQILESSTWEQQVNPWLWKTHLWKFHLPFHFCSHIILIPIPAVFRWGYQMHNFIKKKRLLSLLQNVKWFFWVPILLLYTLSIQNIMKIRGFSWPYKLYMWSLLSCNLNYFLSYCFECINIPTV